MTIFGGMGFEPLGWSDAPSVAPSIGGDTFSDRFGASYGGGSGASVGIGTYGDSNSLSSGGSAIPLPRSRPSEAPGAGPTPSDPSSWRIPSMSDVFSGMGNGPGGAGTNPIDSAVSSGFAAVFAQYVGRVAIILVGLLFVLIGLYALTTGQTPAQIVVRNVGAG